MPAPSLVRNPISLAGAWLTTASALAFGVYLALAWFGFLASPYAGLFGFVTTPALFALGLLLIPFGMWREAKRRASGRAAWSWPAIDLGDRSTRSVVGIVFLLTLVNIAVIAIAAAGATEYTESNKFCGQVCHTPMKPEFTAHQIAPHANVDCVSCHVAPGAGGMVQAKLNGTRQLYLLVTGRYARPIAEPLGRIPTAADTCARCHTPGHPERDLVRPIHHYAEDEHSTDTVTTLTMLVGAIHWHARAGDSVEYVSTDDKRETIPYMRVTDERGAVTEYFADGVTARPAGTLRRMDCTDCHNRPAHAFSVSIDRAVDEAITDRHINVAVPFVRREMAAALKPAYGSDQAASDGIAAYLSNQFRAVPATLTPDVKNIVNVTQSLYRNNVFPEMRVTWGTYPTQLGHVDSPGCFRCHDDAHKSRDGRLVKQDCAVCHRIG